MLLLSSWIIIQLSNLMHVALLLHVLSYLLLCSCIIMICWHYFYLFYCLIFIISANWNEFSCPPFQSASTFFLLDPNHWRNTQVLVIPWKWYYSTIIMYSTQAYPLPTFGLRNRHKTFFHHLKVQYLHSEID